MKWFKNLKTSFKLGLAFATLLFLFCAFGVFSVRSMTTVNDNVENLYQTQLLPSMQMTKMRGLVHQERAGVYRALVKTEKGEIEGDIEQVRELQRQLRQAEAEFEPTIRADEVRIVYHKFKDAEQQYAAYREEKIFKPLLEGHKDEAVRATASGAAYFDNAIKGINDTLAIKESIAKKRYEESQATNTSTRNTLFIIIGLSLLLGAGLCWWISSLIATPLSQVVGVLEAVAKGDLNKQVQIDSEDEVGRISVALNHAINALRAADALQKEQLETAAASARLGAMLESMAGSVTYVDRDGKITYANPAALHLFKKVEKHLPIRADQLVGQSIDILHNDPVAMRKIYSDARNLPYRGRSELNGEIFDVLVSAINDTSGQHMGSLFSWDCVTQKIAQDRLIQETAEREKQQADELRSKVDSLLMTVNGAAAGDLTQAVDINGSDAIGQVGEALGQLLATLRTSISSMAQNASALASSSEELSSVSTQLSSNADETSSQSNVVSAAAEQVSRNVQTVATAVEEMGASIKEIATNAAEAARIASSAVQVANTTNDTISKLGESSAEIGQVIKVITSIAQQTNLLALNATIEAARAGEAGKGFAVVANEVKELAKETAKATEDIGRKVEAIQNDTTGAVEAIKQITAVINQMNDLSSSIAGAVEEQSATTNEMARNVSEASQGSSEIAENITAVAKAAENTTQGAANVQQAASELSRMAAELQQLVSQFCYEEKQNSTASAHRAGRNPEAPSPLGPSNGGFPPKKNHERANAKGRMALANRA
ncbi:MAG TPA: methyl-accepting chemotaxis protein [Gemmataceae bacterium]|nr:methyl-accepting chemotaxis protein [Gemmataceae bacterium]